MPVFQWEGKTLKGLIKKGVTEAPTESAMRIQLRQQGIVATKIGPKGREGKPLFAFKRKVKQRALAIFTRQLATMIDAGLPLVQSLEVLSSQQDSKVFKDIIREIREDVEGGSTFAGALKKHPTTFNELYTNLVVAGEEGGILDTILTRLANYIEKAEALKKKVKSALVYPATIVGVAIIVVPGLILCFYLIRKYYQTEKGKTVMDTLLLKSPVFGPLFQKIAVARFSRTLGTLVSSGVPILDGLSIVSRTAGNKTIET